PAPRGLRRPHPVAVRRRRVGPSLAPARGRSRDREGMSSVSTLATVAHAKTPASEQPLDVGPLGRLGGWTADHVRAVSITWLIVALALAAFAPKVETALSGAGWQANGSESVQARGLIQRNFPG